MIIEDSKIMGPANDVVFKIFFKKNREMLDLVVKEVIGIDIKDAQIEFLDTETQGEYQDSKIGRFDLKVKLKDGEVVYIEMQKGKEEHLIKRMEFYLSRIISDQLNSGDLYKDISKVYGIFFLNYDSKIFTKMFTKLEECDKLNLEQTYDIKTKYIINLKRAEEDKRFNEDFIKLLKFITLKSSKEMSDMAKENKKFEKAYSIVQKINSDPAYKDYIWQKEKDAWDKASQMDQALTEGLKQGKEENTKELVLKMHQNNLDLETISKITQIPIEEIKSIIE